MSANLFDNIPEKFFSPLFSKNRRFYSSCLIELHDQYRITRPEDFTRAFVNEIIESCLQRYSNTYDVNDITDTEAFEVSDDPSRFSSKENTVFYRLEKAGWLEKEKDDNSEQRITFTDAATSLLPVLSELARPNKLSLGGYTRNIIENLQATKSSRNPFTDAFLLAYENTQKFMRIMDMIRNRVRQDVQRIMDCEDLKEMNAMLIEYLDNNLNGDYYKLQFTENLDAEARKKIADLLIDIENNEDLMQKLVQSAQDYYTMASKEDAETYISIALDTMYTNLGSRYEERYNRILHEQARYVSNASMKINAHTIDRRNVRGLIKDILIELNRDTSEDDWPDVTGIEWIDMLRSETMISRAVYIDDASLYVPRANPKFLPDDIEIISENTTPPADYLSYMKTSQDVYTPKKVANQIRKLMGDKKALDADEIPLESRRDFCDFTAIILFGMGQTSEYDIEFQPGRICKNGFDCPNFTITKKQKE